MIIQSAAREFPLIDLRNRVLYLSDGTYVIGALLRKSTLSSMMSSSNEADLHDDSLDLDDDKPSRARASDEGDNG